MTAQPTWISSFGTYSRRVTYPAGATLADLIDTVESVMTTLGWTLYDAAAGANARAYRAVCKDGSRYKYIVLDYNTGQRIYMKTYESWDAGLHIGTNLAYGSDLRYAAYPALTTGGNVSISASLRHALMKASAAVTYIGCFELYPYNENDTAATGYPAHCFFDSAVFPGNVAPVSFCRTRAGLTGLDAARTSVGCLWGTWGFRYYNSLISAAGVYGSISASVTNVYDPTKYDISDVLVRVVSSTSLANNEIKGRVYNFNLVGFLSALSTEAFVDDAQFKQGSIGTPDRGGTATDCWLWYPGSATGAILAVPK